MEEKKIIELAGDFSQKPDMAAITKNNSYKRWGQSNLTF